MLESPEIPIQHRGLLRRLFEITILKSSHGDKLPPNIAEVITVNLDFPLFRSGLPKPQHLAGLKNLGVERIITLVDCEAELKAAIKKDGFTHVNFPYHPSEAKNKLSEILRILRDSTRATLLHCTMGAKRTGLAIAALRKQSGWDVADIFRELNSFGYLPRLKPTQLSDILSSIDA